jgi:hypothetical protein
MRNDPRYHQGPCPVPTSAERERVRAIIAAIREALKAADKDGVA